MDAPFPIRVTRRSVLGGLAAGGLAAVGVSGCGDSTVGKTAVGTGGTTTGQPTRIVLGASFPQSGFAVPGIAQRLPFLLATPDGAPLDAIDGPVAFELRDASGAVVSTQSVTPHADGVPRPYLPLTVTVPAAGVYTVAANYRGASAETAVQFEPPAPAGSGTVPLAQPGDRFVPIASPTTADAQGVEPICTRTPACPLHERSISDVLAASTPLAVLVSTPLFCQTNICGPVLDLVVEAAARHPAVAVIHCEVYANPTAVASIADAEAAPVTAALGLTFEPSMFLVSGAGMIVSRLDTVFDRDEIERGLLALS